MIFRITLFLLLINNAILNADVIHCREYNVRERESQSDSERLYCEENGAFSHYCGIPLLYTCVCTGYWHKGEYNIIYSNFLDGHLMNNNPELLKKVYINDSFVGEIEVNAFNLITNVNELYLQNNNISIIGKGVFNVLRNLTVLDISNNQVSIIESKSFYGLSHLEKLNVSHNKIQIISSDTFDKNLNSIRILDLSHNLITTIELAFISTKFYHQYNFDGWFDIPDVVNNLQLDLSFNKIKSLNFSQLYLNRLSLNNNNLDSLNDLLNSNIIKELDLSNNHLSEFHYAHESTTYLNLSGNILQNLNISFSNSSNIKILDVSQNLITQLGANVFNNMFNLTDLYLKNNDLTEIQIGIFKSLKNLKILSLSGNHLRQFEFGTFSGLSGLLELDISNNSFKSIDYKAFHSLSNLNTLNIANNDLTTLDPYDILNYCLRIRVITLNDNPWNCKSLLNFTTTLRKRRVQIMEGSYGNTKNHLGHACHDMTTEKPDGEIKLDNHIFKNEISDLKKILDSEFRNSNFHHSYENYRNHSIQPPNNFDSLNEYFNNDFKNTSFYKYFNKNISINFPSQNDEAFRNLTETLKLLNLELANLNKTNLLNSELFNLTTNFENKFTSLDLYNKTILNPLNSNLAKLSKSVDKISNHFDKDFMETSFYQFIQKKFQNDTSGQLLRQVSQINQEALSSNISHAKLTSTSERNHDVVEQIENLRGSFIALMTVLILILLIILFLPIVKRFINPLTKKSDRSNTSESTTDLALVQSIRHESLDEQNQLYNM